MAVPPEFLEELRNRVPVSDVVRRHVQIRKQGREWAGLSPFNKEKTPSFFVNDDKRFYHCFSSGKHGDVFSFLMEVSGLNFREAIEAVAEFAGMDVPFEGPQAEERRKITKGLRETLAVATEYYEAQLRMPAGAGALAYLHSRGVDDATIRRFRIGYAPPAYGSLAAGTAPDGVTSRMLVDAGLMKQRDDGRVTDYFRDRIMFPITDRQGKVIAFGGRVLGDGQPKYLNSPETEVFHKGHVLYGLSQCREAAHRAGRVLVVEGYMDVIALAQSGVTEAVAPLGTALGEDQIRLLWSLAPEPVLCLDGDRAGRAAAIRAAERALPILEPGRSLKFAMLPAGEDPDSLVRKSGAEALEAAVAAADSLESVIWQAEWDRQMPTTPERRAAFHRAILGRVRQIGDETVRAYYEQSLREKLRSQFAAPASGNFRGNERKNWQNGRGSAVFAERRRADPRRLRGQRERTLLGLLVTYPELIDEVAEQVAGLHYVDGVLDTLSSRILSVAASTSNLDASDVFAQVRASELFTHNDEASVVEQELNAICANAKAAMSGNAGDKTTEVLVARKAVLELIDALERDSVRAHIAHQVESLDTSPDALDQLEANVAAERSRTRTGF